ncbi:hypothetical protein L2Y94_15810 [Luteibacter aegosomatis]|uniref:DUF6931 family protein n=1 Tax=Luteibacter aegosomatis TaxID=2911537 RepID=UPI001FF97B54|nr:hypothetical protein [Luteibacter aegosomatis]UPG84772.1 hypothetical protein L2Y94_15810 [Luteibacter aegosomatis]
MTGMFKKAADAGLETAAMAVLDDGMGARAAVVALLEAGRAPCALRLQMHLMPRGYVVPWVCECARESVLSVEDAHGLRLAERWLRLRDDASRDAALAHAQERDYADAGALAAACAGWAEGHLVDGQGQAVVPAPHMAAAAAAGALLMLAACREGMTMDDACAAYVRGGLGLLSAEIVR